MADGFQQLKLAVHNRLFETLDVSRLEGLEQNMASTKVTQAITEILNEEGRLLTPIARGWSRRSRTSCSGWVRWNRCCGMTTMRSMISITDVRFNEPACGTSSGWLEASLSPPAEMILKESMIARAACEGQLILPAQSCAWSETRVMLSSI
jgi:hypothetical protein